MGNPGMERLGKNYGRGSRRSLSLDGRRSFEKGVIDEKKMDKRMAHDITGPLPASRLQRPGSFGTDQGSGWT